MKYNIIFVLLVVLMAGCRKYDKSLYIRGRAFLTDTIGQNIVQAPAKNKKIMLSENIIDSTNYNYSVTTDSNGYFTFNLLKRRSVDIEKYRVSFGDSINSIFYSGNTIVSGDQNDIVLNIAADFSAQNAIVVTVTDTAGGAVSGASVYLYASAVLAAINDSASALQTFHSDVRGKIAKFNVPGGNYYLTAFKHTSLIDLRRTAKQIVVPSVGKVNDSLHLR